MNKTLVVIYVPNGAPIRAEGLAKLREFLGGYQTVEVEIGVLDWPFPDWEFDESLERDPERATVAASIIQNDVFYPTIWRTK